MAEAEIPPPPPELVEWLIEVLKSFCPSPVPDVAFARVKRFGLIDQLKVKRGLAQKFRDAGREDEWRANQKEYMAQVREAAREATLEDLTFAFEEAA